MKFLLIVLVAVLGLAGVQSYRLAQEQTAHAQTHAEHAALALAASEANRLKEKELIHSNEKVRNDYAKEKARLVAVHRVTADRLREYEAASAAVSAAGADTAAPSGIDGVFAAIASECARALAALDDHAQRLRAQASALQDRAATVRVN